MYVYSGPAKDPAPRKKKQDPINIRMLGHDDYYDDSYYDDEKKWGTVSLENNTR